MTRNRCVIGICAVLMLSLSATITADNRPSTNPTTRPAVKPARDTTFFTGPLLPDGTVDYIAAINEYQSKGVTPENNAAVLLVQAFGPEMFDKLRREQTLRIMGVKLPKDGNYLPKAGQLPDALEPAMKAPWKANDYPDVAKWLNDKKAPLDLIVAASKRARYHVPLVRSKPSDHMLDILIYDLLPPRVAAKMLVARANLAIGEGRPDDAIADLLAIRRLSIRVNQDCSLLSGLVSVSVGAISNSAIKDWAISGRLSGKDARFLLRELASLPPSPTFVHCWDIGERSLQLDFLQRITQTPDRDIPGLFGMFASPKIEQEHIRKGLAIRDRVDTAEVLRLCNSLFNQLTATMKIQDTAGRTKALGHLAKRIEDLRLETENMPPDDCDAKTATRWVSAALISEFFPSLSMMPPLDSRSRADNDLTLLAVAIAAHKAEKNRYPANLAGLKGAYLKTIPVDVFNGKDYVYKVVSNGYEIYSVGDNGVDDGGKDRKAGGDDIVVRTGNADQRDF